MKILITDDHPIVLTGIRQLVETALPECDVYLASTFDKALHTIETNSIDILIADLDIGGRSGLDLICEVHERKPMVKVIVYTMHEEVWVVKQLLDTDPDAVVLKSDEPDELIRAITTLRDGKGYYSVTFNRLLNSISASPDMLSKRETEIIRLIADGQSAMSIAQKLKISVNTVEFHRRRIMQKLNAANAAESVNKARELGLFLLLKPI